MGEKNMSRCIAAVIFFLLLFPCVVLGDTKPDTAASSSPGKEEISGEWLEKIRGEMDFKEVDAFTVEELPQRISFSELVDVFCEKGIHGLEPGLVTGWLFDLFFYELSASKDYFLQMLCLTAVFAVFKQIMDVGRGYVTKMGFLVIYVTMTAFLMNSFLVIAEVAEAAVRMLTQYLLALIPVYALAMTITGNANTAAGYYEFSFLVMTALGWGMRVFFVPAIHIYLLLRLFDQMFEENRLSKMAELIESIIRHVLKAGIAAVAGISCIQALIGSAQDQLNKSVIAGSVTSLPGVGNFLGSTGNILLGCGVLIRNSVGAASLVVLLAVCLVPVLKVLLFTFLYRLLAAILQPVADKRLVQAVYGTAKASGLYLILLRDCMVMFFLTIAIVTVSGGLIQ